jgi:SAM-dependent methyltransferase
MIEHAKAQGPLAIDYKILDAAEASAVLPACNFDLATSCVALCDMPNPAAVLAVVKTLLKPSGRFVFSVTHPCTDTPYRRWERDQAGAKKWLCVDRYFDEGAYEYPWAGWGRDFFTPGLHTTLETWVTWVLTAGFQIRAIREPRPTPEALASHPDLEDATRVPYFMLFDVVRAG